MSMVWLALGKQEEMQVELDVGMHCHSIRSMFYNMFTMLFEGKSVKLFWHLTRDRVNSEG